ncbi:MAG: mandelate racemase/muconate lactonizing enzyme family protein [Planctomycetaceae bacterium]|jgi:L-alanine-DL-glutamate epimerase-like enolase superfamily enzyme|nr:mandelate racemase/muconate lactonizing enzyme family protein [Planctomycetaceae bacterium]
MIIRDLEFFSLTVSTATGNVRSLIVRLASHTGVEGWGEAVDVAMRQDELLSLRNRLLPILSGRNVFDIEELVHLKLQTSESIRYGLEMACWDMMGRWCKQPLYRLWGGGYRKHIPIAAKLVGKNSGELIQMSQELAHCGYHWQLLPLTGLLDDDLTIVEKLHETMRNGVEIRMDAAEKYEWNDSLKLLREIEKCGVSIFIDPLREPSLKDVSRMQEQTDVTLGVRLAIRSARHVLDAAYFGRLSRLTLEPQQIGSLLEMKKCAVVAEAADIQLAVNSSVSLGPAFAAAAHFAASSLSAAPGLEYPVQFPEQNILKEPFHISDGLFHLASGEGFGVEIDREKLEKYQSA